MSVVVVTNIKWQSAAKTLPTTLPTRMRVEVEDDTPAEALPDQIKYALWRATGSTPLTFDVAHERRQGGTR